MSDQSLEALVGHLYIQSGKSMEVDPPGVYVQTPPRRAPRSRKEDTLFVLIASAGRKPLPEHLFSQLASNAADEYFKSNVGVTGALRGAISAVNNALYDTDYRAGAMLICKRRDEIYLARSGSMLCAMRIDEEYQTFPSDPELLNILPLGSRTEPAMEFSRYQIGMGDVFVMGDAGFAAISDKVLEACISQGNLEQVLDQLEAVITKQAIASVMQFVPPDVDLDSLAADLSGGTSDASVPVAARPVMGSPAGANQAHVSADVDVLVDEANAEKSKSVLEADVAPEEEVKLPEGKIDGFLAYNESTESAIKAPVPKVETPVAEETDDSETSEIDAEPTETVAPEEVKAKQAPPTEKNTPSAEAMPRRAHRQPRPSKNRAQEAPASTPQHKKATAGVLRRLGRFMNTGLSRLLPEPDENAKAYETIPMNLVALIAILIPAIVAIIVVGFTISDQGNTRFEELRDDALIAYDEAIEYSSQPSADRETSYQLWEISRGQASAALREEGGDEELIKIYRESQTKLDEFDNVQRVEIFKLRDFSENADLRGPILAANDIYTLDRNRSHVYQDTLNESGTEILASAQQPVIQRGQRIQNNIVANLVDIEWMDQGGAVRLNSLTALDENGLLISYSPISPPADALQLVLPPDWRRPIAIATWSVNMYVLDAGADQVWRYEPTNGLYAEAPSEYFTAENRPDLSTAVDFGIDDQGALYILFSNGEVKKYLSGTEANFSYVDTPLNGFEDTRAIFVDNNPVAYSIYVAAQGSEALYQVSFGGAVNNGYRPSQAPLDLFNGITGTYVDSSQGFSRIYTVAGEALYMMYGN